MITILTAIIGALFRRYFGGWIEWPHPPLLKHYFKILLGYILSFLCFLAASSNFTIAMACGAIIGTCWWMPYHAWGTWMGDTDGEGVKHPLWECIIVLSLRYGIFTFAAGMTWCYLTGDVRGLIYAPQGFFAWVPYLLAKVVWEKLKLKNGNPNGGPFVVHYTNVGELGLGALMLGV